MEGQSPLAAVKHTYTVQDRFATPHAQEHAECGDDTDTTIEQTMLMITACLQAVIVNDEHVMSCWLVIPTESKQQFKLETSAYLYFTDNEHWICTIVGHQLMNAEVSLSQARAGTVPANYVLTSCVQLQQKACSGKLLSCAMLFF